MVHKHHTIHDPYINRIYTQNGTNKCTPVSTVTRCDNSHLHRQQQTALFVATCSPSTYWIVTACIGRVLRHGLVDVVGRVAQSI
jgi:hypothetical protein